MSRRLHRARGRQGGTAPSRRHSARRRRRLSSRDALRSAPAAACASIPATPASTPTPTRSTREMHAAPGPCVLGGLRFLVLRRPRLRSRPCCATAASAARSCISPPARRSAGRSGPPISPTSTRWSAIRCWSWSRPRTRGCRARVEPRLRVAAGRAARADHRTDGGNADRRFAIRRRSHRRLCDADRRRRHRRADRRAG